MGSQTCKHIITQSKQLNRLQTNAVNISRDVCLSSQVSIRITEETVSKLRKLTRLIKGAMHKPRKWENRQRSVGNPHTHASRLRWKVQCAFADRAWIERAEKAQHGEVYWGQIMKSLMYDKFQHLSCKNTGMAGSRPIRLSNCIFLNKTHGSQSSGGRTWNGGDLRISELVSDRQIERCQQTAACK